MSFKSRTLVTRGLIMLSLLLLNPLANAELPNECKITGVPRVKQIENYCGPASLAAVLDFFGSKETQQQIGKKCYDCANGATNGADMLLYARDRGFVAYSWNADQSSVKKVLAAGIPVIVLQQNSLEDSSGHYRVLVGYNDATSTFYVVDPYYDICEMSYSKCDQLWSKMGNWALMVAPADKDKFKTELDLQNPVVHMDLSFAQYKRKDYADALKEANTALLLEPDNPYAKSILTKIEAAMGAGKKD